MLTVGLAQPILAQVVFGGGFSSILGISLAASGIALYALRSLRPKLARDHDIFFAAVALLCGGILVFQGWRQDPILQFGQFLLTGSAVFFAVESIRMRGIVTEQAKRSTPIVDDERPVSRVYTAEFDDALNPYEERPTRRIRASRDARPRDEYDEDVRPRRSSRSSDDRLGPGDDRPRRRPRPDAGSPEYPNREGSDARGDRPTRKGSSPTRSGNPSPSSSRPKRSRPPAEDSESPRSRERERPSNAEPPSSEYVDYRPVDDEEDNWGDY